MLCAVSRDWRRRKDPLRHAWSGIGVLELLFAWVVGPGIRLILADEPND